MRKMISYLSHFYQCNDIIYGYISILSNIYSNFSFTNNEKNERLTIFLLFQVPYYCTLIIWFARYIDIIRLKKFDKDTSK